MTMTTMMTQPKWTTTMLLLLVGSTTLETAIAFTNHHGNGNRLPRKTLIRIPIHDNTNNGSTNPQLIIIEDQSSSARNQRRKRRRIGLLSTSHDLYEGFTEMNDENHVEKNSGRMLSSSQEQQAATQPEQGTTTTTTTTTSRRSMFKRMLIDSAAMVTASTIFVGCSIPLRYGIATSTTRPKEPSILLAQASASSATTTSTITAARETSRMTITTPTQRTGEDGNLRNQDEEEEDGRTTNVLLRDHDRSCAETETTLVL